MVVNLRILFAVLAVLIFRAIPIVAQEIDFLPEKVFLSGYEFKTISQDSVLKGSERQTLLSALLDHNSIGENDISGSLSYQTTIHNFKLQFGFSDSLNLGVVLPYLVKKRESNLQVADAGNNKHTGFAESYKSAETQGLGDISLILFWRPIYSDLNDFRIRVELNGKNGAFYVSDSDNISMGNGANDLSMFIRWIVYSNSSKLMTDVEVGAVATEDTSISENGNDYDIRKGSNVSLKIDLSDNSGIWNYGAGIKALTSGKTTINGVDQGDNFLAYSYRLFVNLGNLNQLEESTVNRPWSAGLCLENVFSGANAPEYHTIGLKAAIYF